METDYLLPDFQPENYNQEVALEIATALNDLHSIKFHIGTVNSLGADRAKAVLSDVLSKSNVRNKAKYYTAMIGLMSATNELGKALISERRLEARERAKELMSDIHQKVKTF